ncbi:unnamed protein product [Arctia plantaginis]|uniref:Uncharacterized protein n=1 Tax=Arctia plantaginis TaxID=874455 RepID=A0A8S0ZR92_ARCPL|nr:unnamed protein product [Arctia plantaginis]
MIPYVCYCKLIFCLYSVQSVLSMSLLSNNPLFSINSNTEQEVTDYIVAKGYLPVEKKKSKGPIIKSADSDATYLLSKLSDEDLIKLLSEQPNKNEYDIRELVKITSSPISTSNYDQALDLRPVSKSSVTVPNANLLANLKKKRFQTASDKGIPQPAFFRLENKEVDPFATPKVSGIEYSAVQKLNNLLYSRPSEAQPQNKAIDEDEKKELLFDVLVAQLKSLCCKRSKSPKNNETSKLKLKGLLNNILPQGLTGKTRLSEVKNTETTMPNEHMFLVLNDEIKSNGNEGDLISVDPDSLGTNSSVMLLGPIATPLSDIQLKVVMMRMSNELTKPEYIPLLQQISEGTIGNDHVGFVDSVISGPQTRRYIKPHRCNDQSQITRVYGGPKWIICTGYINLNTPSLYD